jgi:hypothetical protein
MARYLQVRSRSGFTMRYRRPGICVFAAADERRTGAYAIPNSLSPQFTSGSVGADCAVSSHGPTTPTMSRYCSVSLPPVPSNESSSTLSNFLLHISLLSHVGCSFFIQGKALRGVDQLLLHVLSLESEPHLRTAFKAKSQVPYVSYPFSCPSNP